MPVISQEIDFETFFMEMAVEAEAEELRAYEAIDRQYMETTEILTERDYQAFQMPFLEQGICA